MSQNKKLIRKYTPEAHPGFLGEGHMARALIQGDFKDTDPFILLMDDMLDKKTDKPAGGPHPHAGFETVSLLLEGEIGDEQHTMKEGDLQMMTAGSGIIHTETIDKIAKMRLLQLWLTLPKKDRWTTPRGQDISFAHVPVKSLVGVEIKLYSGSLAGITSPLKNHTPVTIADIHMQADATAILNLRSSFNTFLYVLEGKIFIGKDKKELGLNQVGWLDKSEGESESELLLSASGSGARFVLYSGQPQGDRIVPHGPFIGDSTEDITCLYQTFRSGRMQHISTVDQSQRLVW